jgi:hypothetical protein
MMPTVEMEVEVRVVDIDWTCRGAYAYDAADSAFTLYQVWQDGFDFTRTQSVQEIWGRIEEACRTKLDREYEPAQAREPFAGFKEGE